jgi:hypothetical protein
LNGEVNSLKAELSLFCDLLKNPIPHIRKLETLFLALLTLASFPLLSPAAEGKETQILLLHTNNVTAHLFPCPT